jgi:hypothetical protein
VSKPTTAIMPNSIDPVRVLNPWFDQPCTSGPQQHTAQVRRRSENDAAISSTCKQQQQQPQQPQQQQTDGGQHQRSAGSNVRGLRRGWSADHLTHHKKKNLVQKGLAFLLESTASVARHPSTAGAATTLPSKNMPPPPPHSSSSPAARWSPNNQQEYDQDVPHHDYEDGAEEDEPNITTRYYTTTNEHHDARNSDTSSPIPQVQNVDTYESEFSGYSSPLAEHEFKILPNSNGKTGLLADEEEPQGGEPTLLIIEEESAPPPARPRMVQTIKPKVSTRRDSKSQPSSRRNQRHTRGSHPQRRRRNHRHPLHQQYTGSSSSSASAAAAAGVAVGTFARFLCGAIPTACSAPGSDSAGRSSERHQQHHYHGDNDSVEENDGRQSSRLRDLFQPLRDKVRMHFAQNSYEEDDDDPSLDRSYLTATTASTRMKRRDPKTSPQGAAKATTSAEAFFHKYLDFVDSIGLASSTAGDEGDDETLTTLGGRTSTSASASIMNATTDNRSRLSELTPYHYRTSATNTTAESAATGSVATREQEEESEEEHAESLYSVEMTYHDQDEGEDNELQQEVKVVPSMTASSGSSSSASDAEYDNGDDNHHHHHHHDDNDQHHSDEGFADGDDDDSGISASDESVLSQVSDQMTIEDADSEESIMYCAQVSMENDDAADGRGDEDDVDDNIAMVETNDNDNNNMSVVELGDSTIVNICRQESSVEYEGIEYTDKGTPPRVSGHRRDDDAFGITHINNIQSSSPSYETMEDAELQQLDQTWIEHDEQGPLFSEAATLASTKTASSSSSYRGGSFLKVEKEGGTSIRTVEEQIEAVFCTKKWMSVEDAGQCEEEIVFTKDFFTAATAVRGIDGEFYETSSDFSSVVVDHVYGLI